MISGCQPRRHSSPMVGFWVQRMGVMVKSPLTQMLQPMHSRMSSRRPSSIFLRQERVGDRGAGGADHVEDAAADLRHHGVGRGEAADADHGLRGQLLHEGDVLFLVALVGEAGGDGVIVPVADVDVPQVRQLGQHRHDVAPFAGAGDAVFAQQLVDGEAHGDGAAVADGLLGVLDDLAQQPHAVLQAAAILVRALVAPLLQEMHGQREVVPGIAIDDVEADLPGAQRGGAMPAAIVADVRLVHGARLHRRIPA